MRTCAPTDSPAFADHSLKGQSSGRSEILRQRARAATALGKAYALRDFNLALVEGGNVPLDVLATKIDGYIAGKKG